MPAPGTVRNVFHVFTDAQLVALADSPSGRFGHAAVGIVILDQNGKTVHERALPIGKHTNNRAELHGILHGVLCAAEVLPVPAKSQLVIHTDSRLAYRGLKFSELHKEHLVQVRDAIRELTRVFRDVDYRRDSRDCKAIRRAEHLARKALASALGRPIRRRGRKGGRRHRKPANLRDPYKGELV